MVSPSAVAEIGKRLRAAREASGRTLEDLAAASRINQKFLQEIEAGRQPGVPDIYFRAFVKTFAAEVGEHPDELLAMMTPATPSPPPSPSSVPPPPPARGETPAAAPSGAAAPAPSVPPAAEEQRTGPEAVRRQAKILVGLALLVVVGLILSVYWLRNEKSEKGIQEISFADVVKEQTAKLQPRDSTAAAAADSEKLPAAGPARPAAAKGDSLLLQAVTSESVWVHIEFDGGNSSEYTLPPGYRIQWKAAKQFSVSLGNPSGVTFVLNGKPLGKLAEGKKPIRNHIVSRASLDAH
jgi:cytoskeletal protein RodZ